MPAEMITCKKKTLQNKSYECFSFENKVRKKKGQVQICIFIFLSFMSGKTLAMITVSCRSCTDPSILVKKKLVHTSWTPWSAPQKKRGAVGTSAPADACSCASEQQLLASPSVPDGSDSRGTRAHVSTPWSVSRDTTGKLAFMLDSLVRVS